MPTAVPFKPNTCEWHFLPKNVFWQTRWSTVPAIRQSATGNTDWLQASAQLLGVIDTSHAT